MLGGIGSALSLSRTAFEMLVLEVVGEAAERGLVFDCEEKL